jgi:hypothetical protein
MAFNIFYSWQSTTKGKYNRWFIKDCLDTALKNLTAYYKHEVEFYLDHDTKDVPGYPNITEAIQKKIIRDCDIYIGDYSVIDRTRAGKGILNPNVQTELGIAKGSIGDDRIIVVMNHYYGDPKAEALMPFDVAQYRHPIDYNYGPNNDNPDNKKFQKDKLVKALQDAIKLVFDSERERRKKEYDPFDTWKTWDQISDSTLPFKPDATVLTVFNTIKDNLKPQSLIRLLGLSGIGKTKLILECFRPGNAINMAPEISDKVLYANMNDNDHNEVIKKIKDLMRTNNRKIVVLDNCPVLLHEKLQPIICLENSTLTLITVSPEPDENNRDIDPSGKTVVIKLLTQNFKVVVKELLESNFDLTPEEIALIVEFSNGLPLYAVLMAQNKGAIHQPGTLTNQNLLERLLGPVYTDPKKRMVTLAASVFQRFGYIKDNEREYKALALCDAICPLDIPDQHERIRYFQKVCEELRRRNILEDVGFSLSFRPTPLALRLAEDWWDTCSPAKFEILLPVLRENGLVESFCKQFRLLSYVENAKKIVADICDGVFKSAEVLKTEEGSRIFRSFVYVNPQACVETLTIAFNNFSSEDFLNIVEGRRNLVWALEQLCFREDTFHAAVKILASFAIAENENISNNAYHQFLQLFHIYLPGTMVDLKTRWSIIDYCIKKDNDYFQLGIDAAIRSLKSDSFIRMGGAISNEAREDYQPSYNEIIDYWSRSISFLNDVAKDVNHSERIYDVFLKSLYSLCAHGGGNIILPIIETLHTEGKIDWLSLRNNIKLILRSGKVNNEIQSRLTQLLEKATPNDLASKIKMYVVKPAYDEYRNKTVDGQPSELEKNIKLVATAFFENSNEWSQYLEILTAGPISEGLSFGKELAALFTNSNEAKHFADVLIQSIISTPPELRNITVFMGFLRNLKFPELVIQIFNDVKQSKDYQFLAFNIASNNDLPLYLLMELVDLVKHGHFSIQTLQCFNYGWGLRHLNKDDSLFFLNAIKELDGGEPMAFSIAYTLSYNEENVWQFTKDFIRNLVLHFSDMIIDAFVETMDYYQWSEAAFKLLRDNKDDELASTLIQIIIDRCNKWDSPFGMRNDFHHLLDILQEQYFDIFWNALTEVYTNYEKYMAAAFYLRDLLGAKDDFMRKSEGVIFKGDSFKFHTVFEWAKNHRKLPLSWIAEWLPLFNNNGDQESNWHPYALEFINEFGNEDGFLPGISANLGTFSWSGSIVDRFERIKNMFNELTEHPVQAVSDWAKTNLNVTMERIDWEKNRESEFGY